MTSYIPKKLFLLIIVTKKLEKALFLKLLHLIYHLTDFISETVSNFSSKFSSSKLNYAHACTI